MSEPNHKISLTYIDDNEHWKWELLMFKDGIEHAVYVAHYIGKRQAISAYETLCHKHGITPVKF